MQKTFFLLSIFVPIMAINAVEPDNGSLRDCGNRIAFRAINNIASPMTQTQSISDADALEADVSDRALDKIDTDLSQLAIDPNAMDNN